LDNVVLPNALEGRLSFLTDLGVNFGGFVENIGDDFYTPIWIFSGFILVLMFKNSMELKKVFKQNIQYLLFNIFILCISLFYLGRYTEFLYFNF
jgi:alginate O-acetyltransferase complex protein AlgI